MNQIRTVSRVPREPTNTSTRIKSFTWAFIPALLALFLIGPATANAQNLTAWEIILQEDAPALNARLSYAVGFFPVGPSTIEFGVDKDNDGLIDGPGSVVHTAPAATTFGLLYMETADIRPGLNALPIGLRVEHGDHIAAMVDAADTVAENNENDNIASSFPLFVDLEAVSLTLDLDRIATLTYLVGSVAAVDDFDIAFYLDDNPQNGVLDPLTDTLVSIQTVSGAAGAASVTADFTADYPVVGQQIFARVDDGDGVIEFDDVVNNVIAYIATAGVDLTADLLTYDEISQDAVLSYTVSAPVDVDPYVISFFLDRDDSGVLDAGDAPAVSSINGDISPGTHLSPPQSFVGDLPAAGQLIFAFVDEGLAVTETDETPVSNIASAQNTDIMDLEAISLTYDSTTQNATFSYLTNSPTKTKWFPITFFLDRDNSGTLTGADTPPVGNGGGDRNPGAHVRIQNFAGNAPASGQQVFAIIDRYDNRVEDNELNNFAATINTTPTDLIATTLTYDSVTQIATLSYTVDAPIDVPAYNIEFAIDTDSSGTPTPGDNIVAVVAGNIAPGSYTLTQSYAADPAASGQLLFAWIDRVPAPGGLVTETDEAGNNVASTFNTATTDIEAIALTYDANTQSATLAYAVNSPIAVTANAITFYLDDNPENGTLDPTDTVADTFGGNLTPGAHTALGDFSSNAPASGQMVFAMVESGLVVAEADENNNVQGTTNTDPIDIVGNLFGSLTYDANTRLANLNYEVVSPIDVPPYNIRFLLDSNNNFIPDWGDTLVADIPGQQAAGLHTDWVSFAATPADSGQAIFALLDTPLFFLGNVLEDNELNNIAVTINTDTTDLEVVSMSYDSNLKTATLSYVIKSPIDVPGNAIQFYLDDTPQNGVLDPTDTVVQVVMGDTSPGAHTATGIYFANPPASNQKVFATIDTANAVNETDENNNFGEAINWSPTNLTAISLAYDSNTEEAVLSYSVLSPINVPGYNIEFFLDRNGSGLLDLGDGPAVGTQVGEVAPGSYATTPMSFSGNVPATGQFIFAVIDRVPQPNGVVPENDESYASNVAETFSTQGTDLVANSVQVIIDNVNNTTEASVSYTIYSPIPVDPFSLKVGLDRDGNGVIDGGGSDVLDDITVSNPVFLAPGTHVIDVANFRSDLNNLPLGSRINHGALIVATLDLNQDGSAAGDVTETEEITNNSVTTAPTVDLIANAIAVITDPSGGWTKAKVTYTVDSPGAVEEFDIRIGVDRDNNGVIDTLADVLIVTHVDGNKLRPGPRNITTDDFRLALNGVTPKLQQNDRIIAILDLNQDNTPVNDVVELDEQGNNVVKQKQKVDLVANAVSLNTDVLGGITEAEVSYTVNSPGSVADFSLKVGLDRDGDGKIDNPDGILSDQVLTTTDVEPGQHTLTVSGLRAALNGLTTPIQDGDTIVATLDLLLNGNDAGDVSEDIEKSNNSTSQIQTVDLVANSIAIQSDDQAPATSVNVSYSVISPADVAAFDIRIGVDRDGDSIIDVDVTDLLDTVAAPDLTPGSHTVSIADIRPALEALATRLADGDRIIATLDLDQAGVPINNVEEAADTNNNVAVQTQSVDLVATEIALYTTAGGLKKARISYTVVSPGTVDTFTVRLGIDSDNNGVLDPGSVLRIYDVEPDIGITGVQPGEHQITTDDLTADLDALALENGSRIIATLDLMDVDPYDPGVENLVDESEDVVNNRARQPIGVDLLAISLAYDSNTDLATLSYSVNSFVGVPAYDITFYLDDNPENGVRDAADTLVATVAGNVLPGEHTAVGDYTTTQVNSSQFIFAVLDVADVVNELDETNNEAATDNTEITDLVANAVTVMSDDNANKTTVSVAYTIIAPDPSSVLAFDILVGVDRDGDDQIDSAADVLETIAAPDLTPGAHEVTSADLRPAMAGLVDRLDDGDRIIAMLDLSWDGIPVNNVVEIGGDDVNNNVAGYAVLVDLVATDLDIFTDSGTGNLIGRVNYTIAGPAAVDAFFVRIGVDADDDKILDPGSLLATIDLSTLAADVLEPGPRMVETADLTAALNALPTPLENDDHLIAIVDLLDDGAGTPENLVVETDDTDNNIVQAVQTVDLVAQSIFLEVDNVATTTAATVTYNINSIGYTADFSLRIGIDRDADDIIDANVGDELFTTTLSGADVLPGEHVFEVADIRAAINALNPPVEFGNRIVATLDLDLAGADEAAVAEINEVGNNITSTAGTQDQLIDIVADELNINVGSFIVTANYTVTGPGNVAPFQIRIGRDTDADGISDDLLADIAGDPTPGAHQVQEDVAAALLALGVASGELVDIVVDVDATGTVVELSELNNKLLGSATYDVDLVCRRITHPCAALDNLFDVEIEYQVQLNQPGEDFRICLYASDDDDATINGDDILLDCIDVTNGADKTVGDHVLVLAGVTVATGVVQTEHFFVKARVDDGGVVGEVDEDNNVLARPNAAQDPSEDADGDGVPDCFDECPADGDKTSPGTCGCGVPDTDTDADGVPDCLDNCPDDPDKLDPGVCGCGNVDDLTDTDFDGIPDCADLDPTDPDVPNAQLAAPGAQEVPTTGENPFQIFLPLAPLPPIPVCGIGLCGTGAMIPLGVMVIGFIGLKARTRRRRSRKV